MFYLGAPLACGLNLADRKCDRTGLEADIRDDLQRYWCAQTGARKGVTVKRSFRANRRAR
jgi:hypothetical protein